MKKLLLTLLLVVSLGAASAFAAESSYTITFKSNGGSSDGSIELTTDTYKNQIESGAEFISSLAKDATKVYSGKSGLKFGSGSGAGTITFNLAKDAQVIATKIEVEYAVWINSKGEVDPKGLTVNGLSAQDPDAETTYLYIPTSTTAITTLSLNSTKRVYVKSITVYYNEGEEVVKKDVEGKPYDDLTLEVDDAGTFASSIADFEMGVTNLTLESSDEEGLLIDGLEYLAMKEGSYVVTVTWAEGSIYNASTSSFNVTVNAATPKFEFKSATDKGTLGELYTLPELTNTYDVKEYTLASSDETVAILSPVDGKSLWIVGEGTTTITATLAGQEGVTDSYELTVSAPFAFEEGSATFDFTVTDAYGLTLAEFVSDGYTINEGIVSFKVCKTAANTGRLWNASGGQEFRVYGGAYVTISVPAEYYLTEVAFTEGSDFYCKQLTSKPYTWTSISKSNSVTFETKDNKRFDIRSVKISYATEKEVSITTPDLKFSKLIAFGDCATIKGTATVAEGVEANVEYLVEGDPAIEAKGDELTVVADPGEYDVTAYVAPAQGLVPAVKHGKLIVKDYPEKVYMIGHYYDRYYDIATPIVLTHQGEGNYTHAENFILLGGSADEGDFGVVFTTSTLAGPSTELSARHKMQAHATDWTALNDGEVIHAGGIHSADEITSADDLTSFVPENGGGRYVISLDLATSTTTFREATDVETGIEGVAVEQGEATYYDLTGRRVATPAAGAYIRVQGGKAQKVMFK